MPASLALAVLTGILLALSFPKFGHFAFAWIALTPLLLALHRQTPLRAFGLGLLAGLVYFTGTVYWITGVMARYGGLDPTVAMLVNAALIVYLALFPALFGVVMARLTLVAGPFALMMAPCVWVATELGRTYLFTGFPWVLLGYSQMPLLPVVQVASVAGVYGVSGLVAAAGAALATSILGTRRRFAPLAITVGLVLAVGLWGTFRINRGELLRDGEPVRVGLVQGNVDQADKWNELRAAGIFRDYLRMTQEAIGRGASFVLWPESATPFRFNEDVLATAQIRALAQQSRVAMLIGSDEVERQAVPKYYNAAFLVRTDGATGGVYRKIHLVPFGEYVPLRRIFFFAERLVEAVSDFSAGEQAVLLPVDGHLASVAICYEIVYPGLVRKFVRGGSQLLTTITNDAWFGPTSAPYQHFAQAAMRAVENGRFLVRAANTGISGIVDPYGRVLQTTHIYESAVVVGDARFLQTDTLYSSLGDWFAYASVAMTAAFLALARRRVQ